MAGQAGRAVPVRRLSAREVFAVVEAERGRTVDALVAAQRAAKDAKAAADAAREALEWVVAVDEVVRSFDGDRGQVPLERASPSTASRRTASTSTIATPTSASERLSARIRSTRSRTASRTT